MSNLFTDFFHSMLPATSSIGIEITDTSIKMAEVTVRKNKKPLIQSFDMEFLKDHVVDDGRIVDSASVTRAIQTLHARLNTTTKSVHMVLPSQSVMVRFLKLPDIPMKQLSKLVDFEVKHHIHLPFDRPVYDYVKLNGANKQTNTFSEISPERKDMDLEPFYDTYAEAAVTKEHGIDRLFGVQASSDAKPTGNHKPHCDIMLVAAARESADQYMSVAQAAGLRVKSLEFKALSLYRIVETTRFSDPAATTLVADINEKASDISIFHGGLLKITRNVPISFNTKRVTTEIASNVNHIFTDFADPDADFRNACTDLAHELERLVNFYRYTLNNRDHEFRRLLISGDAARFPEIARSLAQALSLEVVPFYSDRIRVKHMLFDQLFPMYAVPIGLALRGRQE